MQSDWRQVTLGEFVRLQRGHDLTASEQRPGQFPVMGSAGPNGTHAEFKAFGPGVVIGRSGASMGRVHYCETDYWPHNTCLYVTDFLENNPLFAFYKLAELDLARYNSGSAQPSLNRNYIYGMSLWIPSRHIQDQIVRVVHSIDKKIDLNHRINQTLEAMAQAIFQSWFVDFDPVKAKITAKAEGRDPLRAAMSAISGKADAELDALPLEQYQELAATAALFPDEMEVSELGAIPKGWSVQRVGGVIELAYGKALKSTDRQEGNVPVYGSGGITGYHNMPLVPNGSIIVGRKGTVGSLYWEDKPFFPIDTTYYVRPLAAPLTFCYYAMQTMGLEKMNTDAAVPGLNRENVYRLELVLPDSAALQQFDIQVVSLRTAMRSNLESNQSLAHLRDTLLPKLLSGELSVEALAETAGAA